VKLRDLKLVEEFAGADCRLRFATTEAFLQRFGLASLGQLTSASFLDFAASFARWQDGRDGAPREGSRNAAPVDLTVRMLECGSCERLRLQLLNNLRIDESPGSRRRKEVATGMTICDPKTLSRCISRTPRRQLFPPFQIPARRVDGERESALVMASARDSPLRFQPNLRLLAKA
jgi:hypothetical protein